MNSFNHYSLGSCAEWFYKYVLGINSGEEINEAGFKKIIIKPYIDLSGQITFAKGSYISPYGKICVDWCSENDNIILKIEIPEGYLDYNIDLIDYKIINSQIEGAKHIFILKNKI